MSEKQLCDNIIGVLNVGTKITSLGIYCGAKLCSTREITTPQALTADEAFEALFSFVTASSSNKAEKPVLLPSDGIVASVVPTLVDPWVSALRRVCARRPLVVGPGLKTGVKMSYHDMTVLGADRVADVCAALTITKPPVMVVHRGSIMSIDVVDKQGTFRGGIIAPGASLCAEALAHSASCLPPIELSIPASMIGTSPSEAMQVGVVMGEVAGINGFVQGITDELGYEVNLIITGPDAAAMGALISHKADVVENLTLQGLKYLYMLNRKK